METACSTPDFYAALPVLQWQRGFADIARYARAPDDWCAVVVDVRGSTAAIESGRYKHVNVIGACAIISVLNAIGHKPVAYIFGGDGATLLVPSSLKFPVCCALYGVRELAQKDFGLDLRAGIVDVATLAAQNAPVYVAKKETAPGFVQAALAGAGILLAEQLVKQDDSHHIDHLYTAEQLAAHPADFSGLECRWQPLASRNGNTVSLIVQARGDDPVAAYDHVMETLTAICGEQSAWQPVSETQLNVGLSLGTEAKVHSHYTPKGLAARYLKTLVYTLTGIMCLALGKKAGAFDGATYRRDTAARSDYLKFDSVLRLVMDITPQQTALLTAELEKAHKNGDIFYGMHVAGEALMTCFVMGYDTTGHSHFIDGGAGGYAVAARQMKAQMREAA